MRTTERLTKLKKFVYENLCKGRIMKSPGDQMNLLEIVTTEPQCYLGWTPSRLDESGQFQIDPKFVCPSILIMPMMSYGKYMQERRFDRYDNVHRPPEMGQTLSIQLLFTVYEPGTRLPGFVSSGDEYGQGIDMSLMLEATEQGLFTLLNWMDDCKERLLEARVIPNTDLTVDEDSITYTLHTDQKYITDHRPLYYGFINVTFNCYADEGSNTEINKLLL